MTPNRRLIAQYSDVYRPIIDTYLCRTPSYTCVLVYKSVHTWSQQPNVTPNLRQRMLHRSMCIRRRENAIELSRILFEHRRRVVPTIIRKVNDFIDRINEAETRVAKIFEIFQQTGIDKFL